MTLEEETRLSNLSFTVSRVADLSQITWQAVWLSLAGCHNAAPVLPLVLQSPLTLLLLDLATVSCTTVTAVPSGTAQKGRRISRLRRSYRGRIGKFKPSMERSQQVYNIDSHPMSRALNIRPESSWRGAVFAAQVGRSQLENIKLILRKASTQP